MFKFFSDAKQELEHVVWPTPNETKKYMYYTVGVIVIMAALLSITGYGMQTSLSAIRTALDMKKEVTITDSGSELATKQELNEITNMLSGAKTSVETTSGNTMNTGVSGEVQ